MEANFAPIWSSVDASWEESEMIAHLQSIFLGDSHAAVNLGSPNTSVPSCITECAVPSRLFPSLVDNECYGAVPPVNTGMDLCLDHQHQNTTPTIRVITGNKRIFQMDEQSKKNKKASNESWTIPSLFEGCYPAKDKALRALGSSTTDDKTNTDLVNQTCTSYFSLEDNSVGTTDKSIVLKQNDSSRSRKRSSNNSQSLYAKKRRERINERLRALQQLIPNGSKVDISTMLLDAVQYVKFLQLQIKLLSSDETWMYASLVYNDINIGFSPSTRANQE